MGFVGLSLFLFYWPAANLYWTTAIGLGELYKLFPSNTFALWNPGVLAMLMVFMAPLWVIAVIGIYSMPQSHWQFCRSGLI